MAALPLLTLLTTWCLIGCAERWRPCRGAFSLRRWLANLGLFGTGMALVYGVIAATGFGMGTAASLDALWMSLLGVVVLDLGQYTYHLLEHRVALLWRTHRAHHTDREMDVSTGFRFHPVEVLLRTTVTGLLVLILGLPAVLVLIYAACSYAINNFAHADITLPRRLDRVLRWVIVTPDMHRVHHSVRRDERDSNLGAMFSWWDRLFGTYVESPRVSPAIMPLGVRGFEDSRHGRFGWMLVDPVLDESGRFGGKHGRA